MTLLTRFTSALFVAAAWCSTASAATITEVATATGTPFPGTLFFDVVFPQNRTYAPPNGSLPLVFALGRPDIGAVMQLVVNYSLESISFSSGKTKTLASGPIVNLKTGPVPATTSTGINNFAFLVDYSGKALKEKTGTFQLAISYSYIKEANFYSAGWQIVGAGTTNNIFQQFTIADDGEAAIVPGMQANSSNSTSSTCLTPDKLPIAFAIEVWDYDTRDGVTYARGSFGDTGLSCAVEVDPTTSASISAVLADPSSAANAGPGGPMPYGIIGTATAAVVAFMAGSLFFGGLL
ncbi:hypothetical protein SEUCBS139899_008926 [Sporothrix eucalyptigena]|uniref:DUF7136 domain-containing protein n=1 Tax=Sporothrix eucalyptigena TaxID=1812306 RepID=A0ABP0CJA3_9PEZI